MALNQAQYAHSLFLCDSGPGGSPGRREHEAVLTTNYRQAFSSWTDADFNGDSFIPELDLAGLSRRAGRYLGRTLAG